MANTTEMISLMRHAADLLAACEPMTNVNEIDRMAAMRAPVSRAYERAAAELAAIATASTVLRMVAAAMDDEPTPASNNQPTEITT